MRDNKNPVTIMYGYTYSQSAYTNITRILDDNGMVQLDFYPPKSSDNISFPLNIEVRYYFSNCLAFKTELDNLCKILNLN